MRLIDADALEIELLKLLLDGDDKLKSVADVAPFITNAQTIDAEPIRHGEWIFGETMQHEWMKCSECLKSQTPTGCFTYCPNCGAKMDGERKEE